MSEKYSVTFACYNNVAYTKKCIESLQAANFDMSRLVVVDNASQDETRAFLQTVPEITCIFNKQNLGCGVAWNQGVLAQQAEWTVIMNNDIVVSPDWIENLIKSTEEAGLLVSSPAMLEGDTNYDVAETLSHYERTMQGYVRHDAAHAVCLLVHESVWQKVGYFRATPKLLGFEDTIFFFECLQNGVDHGCIGNSWIHHFGSVTVNSIKKDLGLLRKGGLGDRNNKLLLDQSFWQRKYRKWMKKKAFLKAKKEELETYGITVHGVREQSGIAWR